MQSYQAFIYDIIVSKIQSILSIIFHAIYVAVRIQLNHFS